MIFLLISWASTEKGGFLLVLFICLLVCFAGEAMPVLVQPCRAGWDLVCLCPLGTGARLSAPFRPFVGSWSELRLKWAHL